MPLETHYFDWESVYDDHGVDYLYSRVGFAGRFVINSLTSIVQQVLNGPPVNYDFGPLDTGGSTATPRRTNPTTFTPPNVPGTAGIAPQSPDTYRQIIRDPNGGSTELSHQAIRFRLQAPRGKLYVFWGKGMEAGSPPAGELTPPTLARLFLESPSPGFLVDCKNGPIPRLFSVVEAFGDANTLMADWGVETYVNEASLNSVVHPGAMVSNRFSQTHSIDASGYTTMTTEGDAVFRTDLLYANDVAPDSLRSIAFMPIPQGFTREVLYVKGREDVTGVSYAYRDTQVPVNFVAGPFAKAASISVVHRQAVTTRNDLYSGALGVYERVLGIKANRNIGRADGDGDSKDADKRLRRLISRAVARGVKMGTRKVVPFIPGMAPPGP